MYQKICEELYFKINVCPSEVMKDAATPMTKKQYNQEYLADAKRGSGHNKVGSCIQKLNNAIKVLSKPNYSQKLK